MVSRDRADLELAQRVLEADGPIRIVGQDTFAGFRCGSSGRVFEMRSHAGMVDYQPADMVVTVRAGTSLVDLQTELAQQRQCLPLRIPEGLPGGTVGGGIGMAMPGLLESKWGGWRDWVLGLKLVLADGTVVKAGSRAVKNVAGYDIQKLIVGSRGSLAIVLEATLRVAPISALELPTSLIVGKPGALRCVHRVLRSDFFAALETSQKEMLYACRETGTLWLTGEPARRFDGDWIMSSGRGDANVEIRNSDQVRFMLRAKKIFDPNGKLNPREWECV